ncbi:DNA-binding transcriptional response regulator [Halorarum salinum]|uniref:Response regulatory domain-containing protein n=1 Tax=Halorarum salinum TaxID=2743089 RepID=A0A7D5L8X7_9EURY|nr:hypothetical protein [Halobaculum salinum]QLG60808.1 hypothetical protein HUG12_03215 [Halobaculum salinum]
MTTPELRLLLADENAGFRAAAVELLAREGIAVETAGRVEFALQPARRADCLAVDPRSSTEAYRAAWVACRGPPLVVVTGAPVEDVPEVVLADAAAYVEKGRRETFALLGGAVRAAAGGRREPLPVTDAA